jgi:hypothetical protein
MPNHLRETALPVLIAIAPRIGHDIARPICRFSVSIQRAHCSSSSIAWAS